MDPWTANLSSPPEVVQSWSNVAWQAPATRHHLPDLWQLHVYHHGGVLDINVGAHARSVELEPGMVSILPPGASTIYRVPGRQRFSCLHFRLQPGPGRLLPARVAADPATSALVEAAAAADDQVGAAALAWAALWRAAMTDGRDRGPVSSARRIIEGRLDDPPSVSELARRTGVSAAHLRRLFRSETGLGVKPWIQSRRIGRARHLLAHSSLRIAEIAEAIGVPDLHAFNKLVRRSCGAPPRRLRGRG